jgi:hypothetical protein
MWQSKDTSHNFLDASGTLITSYSSFKVDQSAYKFGNKMYHFVYNPIDQKIYWESISTVFNKGLQKLTYKTKKNLFENTWNVIEYDKD